MLLMGAGAFAGLSLHSALGARQAVIPGLKRQSGSQVTIGTGLSSAMLMGGGPPCVSTSSGYFGKAIAWFS
jgi:hypothetical protein